MDGLFSKVSSYAGHLDRTTAKIAARGSGMNSDLIIASEDEMKNCWGLKLLIAENNREIRSIWRIRAFSYIGCRLKTIVSDTGFTIIE